MILRSLQISGVGPIGFSQQYATQHDILSKVVYVQSGRLSSLVFKVTSTRLELKNDFSGLDVRICPESLVDLVRTTMLSLTFQPFYIDGAWFQRATRPTSCCAPRHRSRSTSVF